MRKYSVSYSSLKAASIALTEVSNPMRTRNIHAMAKTNMHPNNARASAVRWEDGEPDFRRSMRRDDNSTNAVESTSVSNRKYTSCELISRTVSYEKPGKNP